MWSESWQDSALEITHLLQLFLRLPSQATTTLVGFNKTWRVRSLARQRYRNHPSTAVSCVHDLGRLWKTAASCRSRGAASHRLPQHEASGLNLRSFAEGGLSRRIRQEAETSLDSGVKSSRDVTSELQAWTRILRKGRLDIFLLFFFSFFFCSSSFPPLFSSFLPFSSFVFLPFLLFSSIFSPSPPFLSPLPFCFWHGGRRRGKRAVVAHVPVCGGRLHHRPVLRR